MAPCCRATHETAILKPNFGIMLPLVELFRDKDMPLSTADLLALSTVRIECPVVGGVSTGSGFYYAMLEDGERHVPVIATNKHVVQGMAEGRLHMTRADDDGQPIIGQHVVVTIPNFEQQWIPHPSDDVDLCVMPIGGVIEQLRVEGQAVFVQRFGRTLIPNDEQLEDLGALQQVTMIGYPNGLWDSVNNMPLMRQGVCATHPGRDYLGRKEFVIDAACYPGSSGSPVVVFNQGMWHSSQGANVGGERLILLGLLYAGPQITATGEVTVQTVPTTNRVLANVPTMMHLGYVIKSKRLLEMEEVVRTELTRRGALPAPVSAGP